MICRGHTKNGSRCKCHTNNNIFCHRHVEQKCSICLEIINKNPKNLLCNHSFHSDCILQWFVESDTCPICRTSQKCDLIIIFKNKIEDNMRLKYMNAIHSLEDEVAILQQNYFIIVD